MSSFPSRAVLALLLVPGLGLASASLAAGQDAPRILLDQSPRAVQYQLDRLTNDELIRVERRTDDPKYRLIYVALLTRKGLPPAARDEAIAALVTMDKASPSPSWSQCQCIKGLPRASPRRGRRRCRWWPCRVSCRFFSRP